MKPYDLTGILKKVNFESLIGVNDSKGYLKY
jgi:hypothetical protein